MASLPSRYKPFGPQRPGNSITATPRAPDRQIKVPSFEGRMRVTAKDKFGCDADPVGLELLDEDTISLCEMEKRK